MAVVRAVLVALMVLLAVVLQVTLFPGLAYDGVVPNLMLLVVVAAAIARGPEVAAVTGFIGGLALDLVPPADHVAGRWALALVVVAYLAGRVRQDAQRSALAALVTVAAASFVGTSVFALSGLLLRDPAVPVADALAVVPVAVLYDLLLAPLLLPLGLRAFRRTERRRVAY